MTYKVYDTCSLLLNPDHLFQQDEFKVVISSITLDEIENIKTAYNKDAETKYSARKLTKLLEQYDGCYEILLYKKTNDALIEEYNCELTNDMKIIISAELFRANHPFDTIIFVTNAEGVVSIMLNDESSHLVKEVGSQFIYCVAPFFKFFFGFPTA